jgi:4-hydroxy-2-oxoheptanedioate aldolase
MNSISKNQFKAALQRQEQQIGLWIALADSYSAELCASAGFDWVVVDGEHAPNDLRSILGQLQAMAPYPVHPVVRPPIGEVHLIKQLLDIGAQTLLVPLVETAEQARLLVAAMRYPPAGIRGVGSAIARSSRWQGNPDYLQQADDEMCLLVQIETREGLRNLDAIAAVEGVDGLFIGPADLSASLGHRGNPEHPEVQQVIVEAVGKITAAGKAAGILWMEEKMIRQYLSLGYRFVAVGADTMLLAGAARQLAAKYVSGRGRAG